MESYLQRLKDEAASPSPERSSEQLIRLLCSFEQECNSPFSIQQIEETFECLRDFVKFKPEVLSSQVGIRVGQCVVHMLKPREVRDQAEKWIELLATAKSTIAVWTIPSLIKPLQAQLKPRVRHILKYVLKYRKHFDVTLYVARKCLKLVTSTSDIKPFYHTILTACGEAIKTLQDSKQLMACNILVKLSKMNVGSQTELLTYAHQVFDLPHVPDHFVLAAATNLAAYCLLNSIEKHGLSYSIEKIRGFNDDARPILHVFFTLLDLKYVQKNSASLFSFTRRFFPDDLNLLINLMTSQTKKEIFKHYADIAPKPGHLTFLLALTTDYDSQQQTAGLAMQLVLKQNEARDIGVQFFSQLRQINHDLADRFVGTALIYLLNPPADAEAKFDQAIRGMSLIAASILSTSPNRATLIAPYRDDIREYIQKAIVSEKVWKANYFASFILLTVLPDGFIDNKIINDNLGKIKNFFEAKSSFDKVEKVRLLAQAACLYLNAHQNHQAIATQLFKAVFRCNEEVLFNPIIFSIYQSFQTLQMSEEDCSYLVSHLLTYITQAQITNDYVKTLLRSPAVTSSDLVFPKYFDIGELPSIFLDMSNQSFAARVIQGFPAFCANIPKSIRKKQLNKIIERKSNKLLAHSLLLTLTQTQNAAKMLPHDFITKILAVQSTDTISPVRVQLTAELITKYLEIFPERVDIFEQIQKFVGLNRCCFYSALFGRFTMSNDFIDKMEKDLVSMLDRSAWAPYAYHALAQLYENYPMYYSNIHRVKAQLDLIYQQLFKYKYPYDFYVLGGLFGSLFGLVSPLLGENPDLVPLVHQILQCFSLSPGKGKVCFYLAERILPFSKEFADDLDLRLVDVREGQGDRIFAAYTNIVNLVQTDIDFFSIIPSALLFAQLNESKLAADFIETTARLNPKQELTEMVRTVLVKKVLPQTEITASLIAQITMAKVARFCPIHQVLEILVDQLKLSNSEIDAVVYPILISALGSIQFPVDLQKRALECAILAPSISSTFLIKLLEKTKSKDVEQIYLKNLDLTSPCFISIAGLLCERFDSLPPQLETCISVFETVYKKSLEHFASPATSPEYLNFKQAYFNGYSAVVTGMIKFQRHVDQKGMFEFFFAELKNTDPWRVSNSLCILGKLVQPQHLPIVFEEIKKIRKRELGQFIADISHLLEFKSADWQFVFELSCQVFSPKAILYLYNGHPLDEDKKSLILSRCWSSVKEKSIDISDALMISTVFPPHKSTVEQLVKLVPDNDFSAEYKFLMYEKMTGLLDSSIADSVLEYYQSGGCELLSFLIEQTPELAESILTKPKFAEVVDRSTLTLAVLTKSLFQMSSNDQFVKFCFDYATKKKGDPDSTISSLAIVFLEVLEQFRPDCGKGKH